MFFTVSSWQILAANGADLDLGAAAAVGIARAGNLGGAVQVGGQPAPATHACLRQPDVPVTAHSSDTNERTATRTHVKSPTDVRSATASLQGHDLSDDGRAGDSLSRLRGPDVVFSVDHNVDEQLVMPYSAVVKLIRRALAALGLAAAIASALRLRGRGGTPPQHGGWQPIDLDQR